MCVWASYRKKNEKIFFCILKINEERIGSGVGSGSGSIIQKYGSADPDPHQNVTDPQHCCIVTESFDDPHDEMQILIYER